MINSIDGKKDFAWSRKSSNGVDAAKNPSEEL